MTEEVYSYHGDRMACSEDEDEGIFHVPKRYRVYQDDVSLTIHIYDTWQYNPDAYFGAGMRVPLWSMGDANSDDAWNAAKWKMDFLNASVPHFWLNYALVKSYTFLKYWWDEFTTVLKWS